MEYGRKDRRRKETNALRVGSVSRCKALMVGLNVWSSALKVWPFGWKPIVTYGGDATIRMCRHKQKGERRVVPHIQM